MKKICIILFTALMSIGSYGQGFIVPIENPYYLKGNLCFIKLLSGEDIQATYKGGSYSSNGFSKITIERENGVEEKYEASQVSSLKIKLSELAKMEMIFESSSSITEMAKSNYDEILNREYVIFESAHKAKDESDHRLMQLLNPGFDSKIKVFAEPGKKTGGLEAGGVQITGGDARAYLFVKGDGKSVEVKKGGYDKNFALLYADCPEMLSRFEGEKINWDDVALHVFYYDQVCK